MAPAQAASSWQPELKCAWSASCEGAVKAIVLSSVRGKLAACTDSCVYLHDGQPSFARKREIQAQAPGSIMAVAFSSKGTELVSGGADGWLKWWQVDSGEETCATLFPGPAGHSQELAITQVACSKSGLVAAASGRLLCIFGSGGEHLHTLEATGDAVTLEHVMWLDDHRVASCSGLEVTIWKVTEEPPLYEECGMYAANPAGRITCLAASPDGAYLAAACSNSTVQIWDLKQEESTLDPKIVLVDSIEGEVGHLSWDSSSKYLAAAVGNEVLVWELAAALEGNNQPNVCMGYEPSAKVTCMAFQPNGSLLATAADDGQCLVYDANSFTSSGSAAGLISHVASTKVEGTEAGSGVSAMAWHSMGSLLLGTAGGGVVALQPMRAGPQRVPSAQSEGAKAKQRPEAARGDSANWDSSRSSNRSSRASPSNAEARQEGAARPQAGWGGEPLLTNGTMSDSMEPGGSSRGTGGFRGGAKGPRGRLGPSGPPHMQQHQPYKRDMAGAGPGAAGGPAAAGGLARSGSGMGQSPTAYPAGAAAAAAGYAAMAPAGAESAQMMAGGGWGMVGASPMWRPINAMQHMPYMPYTQVMPGMASMPGMAMAPGGYMPTASVVPAGAPGAMMGRGPPQYSGGRGGGRVSAGPAGSYGGRGRGAGPAQDGSGGAAAGGQNGVASQAAAGGSGGSYQQQQRGGRGAYGQEQRAGGHAGYAAVGNGPSGSSPAPPDSGQRASSGSGGSFSGGSRGPSGSGGATTPAAAAAGEHDAGQAPPAIPPPAAPAGAPPPRVPSASSTGSLQGAGAAPVSSSSSGAQPGGGGAYRGGSSSREGYRDRQYPGGPSQQQSPGSHQAAGGSSSTGARGSQQWRGGGESGSQGAGPRGGGQGMGAGPKSPVHRAASGTAAAAAAVVPQMVAGAMPGAAIAYPGQVPMQVPMYTMYAHPHGWHMAYPQQYMTPYPYGFYPAGAYAAAAPMAAVPAGVAGSPMAVPGPHTPSGSGAMASVSGGLSRTTSDASRRGGEPSVAVYVGNLAQGVDDKALYNAFVEFGPIAKAQVIRNADGTNRGFGFVNFADLPSAQAAMSKMNSARLPGPFENRVLKVAPSDKNDANRGPAAAGGR